MPAARLIDRRTLDDVADWDADAHVGDYSIIGVMLEEGGLRYEEVEALTLYRPRNLMRFQWAACRRLPENAARWMRMSNLMRRNENIWIGYAARFDVMPSAKKIQISTSNISGFGTYCA